MTVFRRLVLAALCAGSLAGAFAAVAHHVGTVPVILQAEVYEKPIVAAHEHPIVWEPENGAERTAFRLLADILTGIGFALLLGAGLSLHGGEIGWRRGLFWGLAGFATFTIAPSLGLPPQLPGSEAAPLIERQLWWLGTAIATAGALALMAFTTQARWAIVAAISVRAQESIPAAWEIETPVQLVVDYVSRNLNNCDQDCILWKEEEPQDPGDHQKECIVCYPLSRRDASNE